MKSLCLNKNLVVKLLLFAVAFLVLCPDFTIPSTDYDLWQFYQYKSLCIRCGIGLLMLVVLMFFASKSQIMSAIVFAIALAGAVEAVLSLLQLMGVTRSHHAIFRLTGTFYNPGPLGGYLAACISVATGYFVKHKLYEHNANPVEKYFYGASILLMLMVLPATFSRTGWLALLAALGFLVIIRADVRGYLRANKKTVLAVCLITIVLISAVFVKKSVSASGRFLVWKISAIAVSEKPLIGHGNFEIAYRDASEKYFSQNNWTDAEFRAVDYVDNSFNEYLYMAVKHGIPVALLLVVLICAAVYFGHKKGRDEFVSGVIAIAVFSLASYPLHLADFVVLAITCVACCCVPEQKKLAFSVPLIGFAAISVFGVSHFNNKIKQVEMLAKPDAYYVNNAYSTASFFYEELYPAMASNHIYMYNMAYSFYKNGEYDKAKKYFIKTIEISGNPNAFKYLGKIYLYEKDYANAERCLQRAINILPNRIEPYELLIELYSNNNYKNEPKLTELRHFVATHKFKK